jgi:hypothetical protein
MFYFDKQTMEQMLDSAGFDVVSFILWPQMTKLMEM